MWADTHAHPNPTFRYTSSSLIDLMRFAAPRTLARILLALSSAEGAQRHVRHRLHRTAQDTALTVHYNRRPEGVFTMSRREVPLKSPAGRAIRAIVGWDRPLETFFVQVFERDADGEEDAFIWKGTFPGQLPTPRSALDVVAPWCAIPDGLAAALETDRLKTLAAADGPAQSAAKRALIEGEPRPPRPRNSEE